MSTFVPAAVTGDLIYSLCHGRKLTTVCWREIKHQ